MKKLILKTKFFIAVSECAYLLCKSYPKYRHVQQTSLMAYRDLTDEKVREIHKMILELLTRQHPTPMTDREIAFSLGFTDPNMVRPRRKELVDLGMLREICKKVCDVSQKTAIAWGLK